MPGKYLENSCQDQKNDNDNSGKDFYYGNSSKSAGKKLSQSQSGAEGKISSRLRSSSGTHSSIASNAPSTSTENDGENEANTSLSNERNMINEWAHCAHLLLHPCGRQLLDDIGDVTSLENTHRHSSAPRCNKSGRPSDEQQQKKVNDQFLHSNKVTLWALSQALKPQFSNPFRDKHFAWTYSCRSSISDSHCSQDIVRKRLLASPLGDVSPQASQLQNIDQLLGYVEDIRQSLEDCTNKINLLGHCVGGYNEPDSGTATATTAYDRSISARENQICAFSMMCGGSRVDKKMLYVNLALDDERQRLIVLQRQQHKQLLLSPPKARLPSAASIAMAPPLNPPFTAAWDSVNMVVGNKMVRDKEASNMMHEGMGTGAGASEEGEEGCNIMDAIPAQRPPSSGPASAGRVANPQCSENGSFPPEPEQDGIVPKPLPLSDSSDGGRRDMDLLRKRRRRHHRSGSICSLQRNSFSSGDVIDLTAETASDGPSSPGRKKQR